MNKLQAVILAAGKGTRMNDPTRQKVLYPILGKPMISYILEAVESVGIENPLIVVGHKEYQVKETLGDKYQYVYQRKRLGTGHAILCASKLLNGRFEDILVLAGDQPLFWAATIQKLIDKHFMVKPAITFLSTYLSDPFGLGRILRTANGKVLGIVEEKDALLEQKKIKEVNVSCYIFSADFLWSALPKIKKSKTGEYYLTDLIGLAIKEKQKVTVEICPDYTEGLGVNTSKQLKQVEEIMQQRLKSDL